MDDFTESSTSTSSWPSKSSSPRKKVNGIESILPVLQHDFHFTSAAGYPTYTNYTSSFKDILDYIYVDQNKWDVVEIAPFPNEEVLSESVGLPREDHPSDHMSVAVDLKWKS